MFGKNVSNNVAVGKTSFNAEMNGISERLQVIQ